MLLRAKGSLLTIPFDSIPLVHAFLASPIPGPSFSEVELIIHMTVSLPSFYFPQREGIDYLDSQSVSPTTDRKYPPSAIVVFYLLQIAGGHVGIPIILITLRVKRVQRHPMLVNFLITWIIYSTSFCILLYLGKQFGSHPSTGLCTVQASLIYGTAVLTPTAGLCFVLNLWFTLRDAEQHRSSETGHSLRNYLLISAPYVVFLVCVTLTAMFGAFNPGLVSRSHYVFYCTLYSSIVDIVPGTAAIILLTVIVFEGKILTVLKRLVAFRLYRMRKAFRDMNSNGGAPTQLFIRIGIFSVYSFLAIISCITFWAKTGAELPYIIQASLPTAAFIIFGTQKDLLEAWGFVRKKNVAEKDRAPDSVPSSVS